MQSQSRGFVIGVEVGATKIAAGLVDDHGEILWQTRLAMVANETASAGLNAVVSALDSAFARCAADPRIDGVLRGIGIRSCGPLNPTSGVIVNAPNLSRAGVTFRSQPKLQAFIAYLCG
jgi:glucokinase